MKKRRDRIKAFWTKRKVLTVICIVIPSILIVLSGFCKSLFTETMENIEVAYYTSQIIATIFLIAGTVIAVWQYYITSKDSARQLQLEQVQRAIDLSEYYKNNILEKYRVIYYVYAKSGILEIMENIKASDMIRFDANELNDILSEKKIKELKNIQYSDKFIKAVIEANSIYKLNMNIETKIIKKENAEKYMEVKTDTLLTDFILDITMELLNSMEYFSMHFRHNTADESVVYRSLHQSYLEIVQGMYFSIAKNNKTPESKYYTNVIWLYTIWYKKIKKR